MSRINDLIQKYCAYGVEYRTVKEVVKTSFWLMPSTPHYIDSGIPYITSKNIKQGIIDFENVDYISEEDYRDISKNRPIQKGDVLITMIGTIGEISIVNTDRHFYGQNIYLVRMNTDIVLTRFYYHYFLSKREEIITKKNTSSQGYIKAGSIENMLIPIPPLAIQEEIVRILDTFTELTTELQTELEGRRKQYEWYRDNMLYSQVADYKAVEEVSYIVQPMIKVKSNEYLNNGKYPIIDQGQDYIGGYTNEEGAFPQAEYIIFGDHTCVVKYADFPFVQGADGVKVIRANKGIIPKYLYYCMSSIRMEVGYSRHWSKMRIQQIPIPSFTEQERIVKVLDSFDSYCNDLSQGLPKEIELRQRQYEYYRDKLLMFKEKTA